MSSRLSRLIPSNICPTCHILTVGHKAEKHTTLIKIFKMNKIFLAIAISLLIISCNEIEQNTQKKTTQQNDIITEKQDSLAFELAMIYGADQSIRHLEGGGKARVKIMQKMDTLNFNRIKSFIELNGMLSEKLLGKKNFQREPVQGAFIAVMLHNPHRLINEKENMQFFLNLVKKGELKEITFLTILDKYYWTKNKKRHVLYGGALGMPCINNKVKTNKARKELGFKPLADSLFIECK